MKNATVWKPSKFVHTPKGWSPSSDQREVGVGSRFIAAVQLPFYHKLMRMHVYGKLLDVGCGKVPYYGIYRELISENICIDWAENAHVDSVVDLNGKLPLPDSAFDSILCSDVLEHIADPFALFVEMARVLKPGGHLLVFVPFFYHLHEQPHDYFRYTEYALKRFGEISGIETLVLEPYGGAPEIILDILAKNISQYRWLSAVHLKLGLMFVRSRLGTSISQRTRQRFPLGYCFVGRKRLQGSANGIG